MTTSLDARPLISTDDAVSVLIGTLISTPRWRWLVRRHLRRRIDRLYADEQIRRPKLDASADLGRGEVGR